MPGLVDVFAVILVDASVFVLLLSLMFYVVLYMFCYWLWCCAALCAGVLVFLLLRFLSCHC